MVWLEKDRQDRRRSQNDGRAPEDSSGGVETMTFEEEERARLNMYYKEYYKNKRNERGKGRDDEI